MTYYIEPCYIRLADNIRARRCKIGMTQVKLAKRMKMSRPSLANIEVGRQRIALHDIARFASHLGTTHQVLMRGVL